MPHFNLFKKRNKKNILSLNSNCNNNIKSSTSLGLTADDLPNNNFIAVVDVGVQSVRKNGKRKKNWKNALIRLHHIWPSTTNCYSRKKRSSRNKKILRTTDKENITNTFDVIENNVYRATKSSITSSSTTEYDQKNDSENVVAKVHITSRFISTKADVPLKEDFRDEEIDFVENDKTKTTLIERCATIPRRSSETEVLARKGRFTIIREGDNNNNVSSRTGEGYKSLSSSYSSCCTISQSRSSSSSSLPVSLSELPDSPSFKGSIRIKSHEQLSPISPYYLNSPICSSPLSSNYYYYNSLSPRRASDSFAHHQSNLVYFNNKSLPSSQSYPCYNKPTLYITPLPKPHSSPIPIPTPILVSSSLKQSPFTSTFNRPNSVNSRDSLSLPDTPYSSTSTTTTTSIVSTPSGRKFELEGSYFSNNSTFSPGSNNNFGPKRRRKFIVETFE
ncbi:8510_t:CDS:2 [Funneliformis caledonium]|uniref:8510_t:CDS:1 n=1 Tax=Funneliformis caledonium TaxID=1117310 RepID=A0A9N9AGR4_9GLOM|nr:8510_t:CDS:2 [Funneliformis caledonium]